MNIKKVSVAILLSCFVLSGCQASETKEEVVEKAVQEEINNIKSQSRRFEDITIDYKESTTNEYILIIDEFENLDTETQIKILENIESKTIEYKAEIIKISNEVLCYDDIYKLNTSKDNKIIYKNDEEIFNSKENEYIVRAEEIVRDNLKNPDSAKLSDIDVTIITEDSIVVKGTVVATNGFGGDVTKSFTVYLTSKGDTVFFT